MLIRNADNRRVRPGRGFSLVELKGTYAPSICAERY